jgi:hypothetical protein
MGSAQSPRAVWVRCCRKIITEHRRTLYTQTILERSALLQCHGRLYEATRTMRNLNQTWLYTILRSDFETKLENTMPAFSITLSDSTYILTLPYLSSLGLLASTNEALRVLMSGSELQGMDVISSESIVDTFEQLHC